MDAQVIAISIPFFLLCMVVEIAVNRYRVRLGRESVFRLADSITSLSCGIGQQLLQALFITSFSLVGYAYVSEHWRLVSWPTGWVGWALAFLAVDFLYWAYHYASHRVNFFWATHVVHHSSEEYNLTTALRQSWFTNVFSWVFYLPLAFLGVELKLFATALTLNIVYQFWIHTKLIGKLGPLEWVMNTPSHHRAHHGIDPEYIDRNYAGTFIIWDRLFKTFVSEERVPSYGVVNPLASFNPLWANVEGYAKLWHVSKMTKRWRDKLYIWVSPPEWMPEDMGGVMTHQEVSPERELYSVPGNPFLSPYLVTHFAVLAGILGVALQFSQKQPNIDFVLPRLHMLAITLWGVAAVTAWGGLIERRPWALMLEALRLVGGIFVLLLTVPEGAWKWPIVGVWTLISIGSLIALMRAQKKDPTKTPSFA